MQSNLTCFLCDGEAKLACSCAGHEVMFCLLHYNSHLQDKSKPHTFTTLKKLEQPSNLHLLKKLHKLDEISIELLSYKDKVSNHLEVYHSIKSDLINLIQEIFMNETCSLELSLFAITEKIQLIESFKQNFDQEAEQIIEKYDKSHLAGLLDTVPELNPVDLFTITGLLYNKLGLDMKFQDSSSPFDKELLECYNKSLMSQMYFNMVQSQTYQELQDQNEDLLIKIENFKKDLNSYIRKFESKDRQMNKLNSQVESYKSLVHNFEAKIKLLDDQLQKYIVNETLGDEPNEMNSSSESQAHDLSYSPSSEQVGVSSSEEQIDTIVRLRLNNPDI